MTVAELVDLGLWVEASRRPHVWFFGHRLPRATYRAMVDAWIADETSASAAAGGSETP